MSLSRLSASLVALSLTACSVDGPGLVDPDPDAAIPDAEVLEPWLDTGTSEDILGYHVIPAIELLIEPDAIAALEAAPREYVRATIVFEGERYGPVGVRLKGQNSFLPIHEKPSLRINVNEYIKGARFRGLKDLTFNNMSSDHSMMHERLAYLVARAAGLPASRANHMVLTINGEPYGLYTNVETVKARMIGGWFADNTGSLFEATDVDFAPAYVDAYEQQDGPGDRTLLAGLATALTIADPDQAIAAAAAYVDIGHFQRFWAMESVIAQYDAFPYSVPGDDYFVYADPTTRKLWFLPWGMDETFLSAEYPPTQTHSVFAAKCKASPACFQGYVDQVWAVLAVAEALGLDAERARVQAEIAPLVAADVRKPYSAEQVAEGQLQLRYFTRHRRETLTNLMPPPSH